jgi:hypothetical protein
MTKFIVTVILSILASTVPAKPYFELGIESGGETLVSSPDYFLNADSGLKFVLGVQYQVGEHRDSVSLSLGYLFDDMDASSFGMFLPNGF